MAYNLSSEELQSFHTIDRELFTRLVTELERDRDLAMRAMAFWLWAEEVGYPSVILSVHNMPGMLVNAALDEVVSVLECLDSETMPPPETPITFILMHEEVTLDGVYANRGFALAGVSRVLTEVCSRAFADNVEQVAAPANETGQSEEQDTNTVAPNADSTAQFVRNGSGDMNAQKGSGDMNVVVQEVQERAEEGMGPMGPAREGLRPVFDFRTLCEAIEACAEQNAALVPLDGAAPEEAGAKGQFEVGQSSTQEESQIKEEGVPQGGSSGLEVGGVEGEHDVGEPLTPEELEIQALDARSMFFTFSRGYVVTEQDLHSYFER